MPVAWPLLGRHDAPPNLIAAAIIGSLNGQNAAIVAEYDARDADGMTRQLRHRIDPLLCCPLLG
jgi:hypothetical protein